MRVMQSKFTKTTLNFFLTGGGGGGGGGAPVLNPPLDKTYTCNPTNLYPSTFTELHGQLGLYGNNI